jgi:hypothetical protein
MINGNTQETTSRSESEWSNSIAHLEEKLLSFRDPLPGGNSDRLREDFYESFRNLSEAAAKKILATRSWRGDRLHDAEDISSSCTVILLNQESRRKGIFNSQKLPSGPKLRGYLNRTIWGGARQGLTNLIRRDQQCLSLDESIFSIKDHEEDAKSLWDDVENVRFRLNSRIAGRFKTPSGKTPLDSLLAKALADAGERKLYLEAGVPLRSWQREEQAVREELRQSLGQSTVWTQGRQDARRKATHHRDPDL